MEMIKSISHFSENILPVYDKISIKIFGQRIQFRYLAIKNKILGPVICNQLYILVDILDFIAHIQFTAFMESHHLTIRLYSAHFKSNIATFQSAATI